MFESSRLLPIEIFQTSSRIRVPFNLWQENGVEAGTRNVRHVMLIVGV